MMLIFFFNDTATTEIYTLSLHDALPISWREERGTGRGAAARKRFLKVGSGTARCQGGGSCLSRRRGPWPARDRKSTRLNSSHANISYAVFCLKKKNTTLSQRISLVIRAP